MRPLSVKSQLIPTSSSEMNIFLPEAVGAQLEFASEPYNYDIIIVSSLYANIARQTQGSNPDYLDRLYSPITLYSEDPQDQTILPIKSAVWVSERYGILVFHKNTSMN